ncbi:MAG: alpha-glucosidase, partial [Clostridia bacterium]|nr:alpha-glucosidase [Clostridia bacterium]
PSLPKGYLALLRNYCGVYDLTAEAILCKSKDLATQAIIANPIVNQVTRIDDMVSRMIDIQNKWLGYLQ